MLTERSGSSTSSPSGKPYRELKRSVTTVRASQIFSAKLSRTIKDPLDGMSNLLSFALRRKAP
jgi:hypothetical protein